MSISAATNSASVPPRTRIVTQRASDGVSPLWLVGSTVHSAATSTTHSTATVMISDLVARRVLPARADARA